MRILQLEKNVDRINNYFTTSQRNLRGLLFTLEDLVYFSPSGEDTLISFGINSKQKIVLSPLKKLLQNLFELRTSLLNYQKEFEASVEVLPISIPEEESL